MITDLRIRSFKRFDDENFALRPLTVLTGLNGSGKTSVIHSLLLTWEASAISPDGAIRLNGPFGMELGVAEEVRNWRSDGLIEFHLASSSGDLAAWKFGVPASNSLYLTVEERPATALTAFGTQPRSFSYLCAERLGPRSVLGASPLPSERLEVGVRG